MRGWLRRHLHHSMRLGPIYISTWDWERQHDLCCRIASAVRCTEGEP